MSALLGYDGASPFDLAAAKAHGAIVITGYIVGHPGGMDPINKTRVDRIRSMGMGFLPNVEHTADYFVKCSKADGHAAAVEAVAAMRALGLPDDGSIACPFSWDVWIDPRLYLHCGQVADGIIDGLAGHYRFSAYGQGGLIDYLVRTGRMQPGGWLSGSSSFPGFDPASPNVAMVQSHDVHGNWLNTPVPGTDVNTVTRPELLGAWWPEGSEYDMALTAQDVWDEDLTDGTGLTQPASMWLKQARNEADAANAKASAAVAKADALVAQNKTMQSELTELAAQVAKLQTGPVDTAAVADQVVSKMGAKLA